MSKNLYEAVLAAINEEFSIKQACEVYHVKPVPLVQAIAEYKGDES